MRCSRCEAEWTALAEMPSVAMACPYCNVHVCGCGCGADLSDQRRDSIYRAESHWRQLQRAQSSDVAPIRSVAEARALQEDAKAHWSMVADEGIYRYFKANLTGEPFHADDLRELGMPLEHCNVIPSQIAKWVNRGFMVSCGERKSRIPSRHAAKSKEYRLTEKGVAHVRKGYASAAGPQRSGVPVEPARLHGLDVPERRAA